MSRFWAASGNALLLSACFSAVSGGGAATTWGSQTDWDIATNQATRNRTATFWGLLHASVAKASGTVIFTINALGSVTDYVGFDDGTEANNLGGDGTGASFGWTSVGQFVYGGAVQAGVTLPAYAATDVLKMVKSANSLSFYHNTSFVTTVDLASAGFGSFTKLTGAAYPSVCSNHATGFQVTADFTGF